MQYIEKMHSATSTFQFEPGDFVDVYFVDDFFSLKHNKLFKILQKLVYAMVLKKLQKPGPSAGKLISVHPQKMRKLLNYPVLHLDKHIPCLLFIHLCFEWDFICPGPLLDLVLTKILTGLGVGLALKLIVVVLTTTLYSVYASEMDWGQHL